VWRWYAARTTLWRGYVLKLRKSVETIFCEERYTAIRVANYIIVNVYLPCVVSPNRLLVCEELLANISALCQRYRGYEFIIASDLNTDLDSSDPVAVCINKFLVEFSLLRCDSIFPLRKSVTYVNESLGHESCIDYVLVSDAREVLDFEITAPEINFSDHLPLTVIMQGGVSNVDNELNYDSKPKQFQLRWDRGDTMSFYQHTGHFLTLLLSSVEEMLLACNDNNTGKRHQVDLAAFVDFVYFEIVHTLTSGAEC